MQQVLNPPDAALGIGGRGGPPRGKLLGHGADVRPFAGAGELGGGAGGGVEGLDCGWGEEGWDHDEAVVVERSEVWCRGGGRVGHCESLDWSAGLEMYRRLVMFRCSLQG
jgi:hypothetical protein